jgi:hypothetical protein
MTEPIRSALPTLTAGRAAIFVLLTIGCSTQIDHIRKQRPRRRGSGRPLHAAEPPPQLAAMIGRGSPAPGAMRGRNKCVR